MIEFNAVSIRLLVSGVGGAVIPGLDGLLLLAMINTGADV